MIFNFICHSFSHDSYWTKGLLFLLRVRHYLLTTFLKYHFCARYFVIILYALSFFLSFIAKGLAMCRLGGVISFQKVLF